MTMIILLIFAMMLVILLLIKDTCKIDRLTEDVEWLSHKITAISNEIENYRQKINELKK